jgi:glycosyltransferase involved in cell wall biosynthesis
LYSPNYGGGAEISLKIIVEGIQSRGYEVVVLSINDKKGLSFDYVNGVKVYRAGIENSYWPFSSVKKKRIQRLGWHLQDIYNDKMSNFIKEVITLEKPNLAFCHNLSGWSISAWDVLHANHIPIVQVLHDLYLLCPSTNMFRDEKVCESQCVQCKLFRINHAKKSEKVAALIGVSKYSVDNILKYNFFKNAMVQVIHNSRTIEPQPPKKILEHTAISFGFIGTLTKAKGIENLIKIFMTISGNIRLMIAGVGEDTYTLFLKNLAKDDDRITFLGFTKAHDFFKQVNVCVVPSIWPDTFPGVAFEACAYNVAVIANNIGGLPEIVKHEINGILCNPKNVEELRDAILTLRNNLDLLNALCYSGRNSVLDLLSKDRMLDEYEDVIKRIT